MTLATQETVDDYVKYSKSLINGILLPKNYPSCLNADEINEMAMLNLELVASVKDLQAALETEKNVQKANSIAKGIEKRAKNLIRNSIISHAENKLLELENTKSNNSTHKHYMTEQYKTLKKMLRFYDPWFYRLSWPSYGAKKMIEIADLDAANSDTHFLDNRLKEVRNEMMALTVVTSIMIIFVGWLAFVNLT